MTTPTPNPPRPDPLNYASSSPINRSVPCLIVAILLAIVVGLFAGLAVLLMTSDQTQWHLGLALFVGIILVVAASIFIGRRWTGAALAILIAAVCVFVLTLGLCSQFTFGV